MFGKAVRLAENTLGDSRAKTYDLQMGGERYLGDSRAKKINLKVGMCQRMENTESACDKRSKPPAQADQRQMFDLKVRIVVDHAEQRYKPR